MAISEKYDKYIYWSPRILGIMFILFLMFFSLDVFEPGLSPQQIAIALFMHNIPALLLLTALKISWKREIVGGIVFILAGLLYIALVTLGNKSQGDVLSSIIIIAGPAFMIGILFILNWRKRHTQRDTLK